jgi:hypothetical protein
MDSPSREAETTTASVKAVGVPGLMVLVNISEQPLNTVTSNRLKTLISLSQNGTVAGHSSVYWECTDKELPVERLDLTHHVTYVKHGKPVSLPNLGRKAARPDDGGAGRGGRKKRTLLCNGADRD